MILKGKHYTCFLGFWQTFANRFDTPFHRVVIGVALQRRFISLDLHELIERLYSFPAAGVETDRRYTELSGDVDASLGVLDVLATLCLVREDKILMNG